MKSNLDKLEEEAYNGQGIDVAAGSYWIGKTKEAILKDLKKKAIWAEVDLENGDTQSLLVIPEDEIKQLLKDKKGGGR